MQVRAMLCCRSPGNAPVIIHKDKLRKIVPLWTEISLKMKGNPSVEKAFGWIQEMYAYSLASALAEEEPVRYDMHMEFMLQPPFDGQMKVRACWPPAIIRSCPTKPAYIIHYTYGQDIDPTGKFQPGVKGYWHWDKRDYIQGRLPRNIPEPPEGTLPAVVRISEMINEAAEALWPR